MGHDLPDELPTSSLNEFNYYMDNQRLRIEVRDFGEEGHGVGEEQELKGSGGRGWGS